MTAFDAVTSGTTNGSSVSWTHTCTGTNLVLVVDVAWDNIGVSGTRTVSYTKGGSTVNLASQGTRLSGGTGKAAGFFERFVMVAPDTGAHSVTISITGATTASIHGAATSWTAADQTTGVGTQTGSDSAGANATSGSLVQPTSTSGGQVLAGFVDGSDIVVLTAGTSRFLANAAGAGAAGDLSVASSASTGSSVTISWTMASDWWGGMICEVLPFGGAAPSVPPLPGPTLIPPGRQSPMAWQWLQPPPPTFPPGVTDVPQALADTATIADTISVSVSVSLTDTATTTDSLSVAASVSLSDTATISDFISVDVAASMSETATISDTATVTTIGVALADAATVADAIAVPTATVASSDTATISDAFAVPTKVLSLTDTATISDSTVVTAITVALPDTATITDTIVAGIATPISDTATISDAIAVPTMGQVLADAATVADALAVTSETIGLSDAATVVDSVAIGVGVIASDAATISDSIAVAEMLGLAESATITDTLSVASSVPLADIATIADAIAILSKTVSLSDTAVVTDAIAISTVTVALADTVSISDSISIGGSGNPSFSDAATISDTIAIASETIALSDTVAITDSVAIASAVPFADTVAVSDAVAVPAKTIALTEAVVVSDAIAVASVTFRSLSDTAAVADSISVSKTTPGGPEVPQHLGGTLIDQALLGGNIARITYGGTIANATVLGGTNTNTTVLAGSVVFGNSLGGSAVYVPAVDSTLEEWTMQEVDIGLAEFNDETLAITLTSSGSPLNITGLTLEMYLKATQGDADTAPTTVKLSTVTGEITITDALNGKASVAIPNADLQPGDVVSFYRVDVVQTGKRHTALYGKVGITQL